jgi:LmbE family N-acetylglucosaminyl deacetylase
MKGRGVVARGRVTNPLPLPTDSIGFDLNEERNDMQALCAIFAHPDDESFSAGGTLARYAAAGVRVTLVTATSGEAGEAVDEGDVDGLAERREGELLDAAAALGIHDVRLLRLPVGDLPNRWNDLHAATFRVLDEIRPHVVVIEDIQGITGHHDHIAVTGAVHRAFDDLDGSGSVKLYEHVVPQSIAPPESTASQTTTSPRRWM